MRSGGPSGGRGPMGGTVPTTGLSLGAFVLCLLATAVVLTSPRLLFGFHHLPLHLILDSVDACIAVLVASLLVGRFRRDRSLRSLLLATGLLLLALANLVGGLAPSPERFTFEVWWPQSLRVLGAALIAVGAFSSRRVGRRLTYAVLSIVTATVLAVTVTLWWMRDSLPVALETTPVSAVNPNITGHPVLLLAHLAGAGCFLLAAAAFTVRARRDDDEMLRWFGPACVLGTFSRIHYVLFPSIYSGWIYTGDVLRTGCYLLLLMGAVREINRHWAEQPGLAVVEDRRRLARELHDGVVQELGYIGTVAHDLPPGPARQQIGEAARRGQEEARTAVAALAHGEDESMSLQLHRTARQLTDQYGARVVVDLDVSVQVTRDQAHALVRITREAVGNAIRHGGANSVGIGLLRDQRGPMLVVHDDGRGFDPESVTSNGYGLTSMRDRAAGLPGEFSVKSAEGRGTTVTVTW